MSDQDNSWVESERERLLAILLKERFGDKANYVKDTPKSDIPQP